MLRRAPIAALGALLVAAALTGTQEAVREDSASARPPQQTSCLFAFSSRLDGDAQMRRFLAVGPRLSVLAPNWYDLDRGAGAVRGAPATAAVRAAARKRRVALWPVVNARVGFEALFSSATVRRRAARQIAALAAREHVAGITLDIEGIRPADRAELTAFVRDTASRLHRGGRRLGVYATRRTSAPPTRSAAAYDWPALARAADLVLGSGYNEHHARGAPGPTTTPAGFARVTRFAASVSRRRVAPVMGAFGYRWPRPSGEGALISSAQAQAERLRLGRPATGSGGAVTYASGRSRVWYETGAGLRARAATARRARLRWVGLFSLGREPAGTLQRIPRGHRCARAAGAR